LFGDEATAPFDLAAAYFTSPGLRVFLTGAAGLTDFYLPLSITPRLSWCER
jgi:hypothetical protein